MINKIEISHNKYIDTKCKDPIKRLSFARNLQKSLDRTYEY